MIFEIVYEGALDSGLKKQSIEANDGTDARQKFLNSNAGVPEFRIKDVLLSVPAKAVPSKRALQQQAKEWFLQSFVELMIDGEPRCLRDIGPVVGNTYTTGLSARIRGLRPFLATQGLEILCVKVGTPEEGTWYQLVKSVPVVLAETDAPIQLPL